MTAAYRASANGGGTAGTTDRSVAIAALAGDLLVIIGSFSGTISATPSCSDDAGGTYTRIAAVGWSAANGLAVFVRDSLVATGATITATVASFNTAGELHALAYTGMIRTGSAAIRSSGTQATQTGGTPAPTLSQAARDENPTIVALASDDTTTTPPTNWTERLDTSQVTPTTALETATRDSGFTGTTITFGAAVTTLWASIALELESPWLVDPATIASTESVPQPAVGGGLAPPLVASSESIPSPAVGAGLAPPTIATTESVPAPAIGPTLLPVVISSTASVPSPRINPPDSGGVIMGTEVTMSDLADLFRTASSPGAEPDGEAIAINASGQDIGAASAGFRRVAVAGSIVAVDDCVVEFRSGGSGGTLLYSLPLAARVPVPLAILGLVTVAGQNLYAVTADAIAVTGRALTELV